MKADTQHNPLELAWAQIIAKIWSGKHEQLRQKVLKDPKSVLAESGVPIPQDTTVKVHEDSPSVINLVLPPKPEGLPRTEENEVFLFGACPCTNCSTGGGASSEGGGGGGGN